MPIKRKLLTVYVVWQAGEHVAHPLD